MRRGILRERVKLLSSIDLAHMGHPNSPDDIIWLYVVLQTSQTKSLSFKIEIQTGRRGLCIIQLSGEKSTSVGVSSETVEILLKLEAQEAQRE